MKWSEPARTLVKITLKRRGREWLAIAAILVSIVMILATIGGAELMLCRISPPLTVAKALRCFRK